MPLLWARTSSHPTLRCQGCCTARCCDLLPLAPCSQSLETHAAEEIEGVTVVREGDFVGVVAPDEHTAAQAIDALRPQWRTELQVSQPELFEYLKANVVESVGRQGPYLAVEGSVADGLAQAHVTLQQRYTVDYIAHVPLEPRVAVAQWVGDELTVWTGSQRPFGVRAELAAAFGLPARQVRVIVPDTGAGYGGKHAGDAAVEAARLARAVGQAGARRLDAARRSSPGPISGRPG